LRVNPKPHRTFQLFQFAIDRGAQLLAGLRNVGARYPSVGDVRGLGLMVAIELIKPGVGDGRTPDPDLTKRIQAEALARKLIVLTAFQPQRLTTWARAATTSPVGRSPKSPETRVSRCCGRCSTGC